MEWIGACSGYKPATAQQRVLGSSPRCPQGPVLKARKQTERKSSPKIKAQGLPTVPGSGKLMSPFGHRKTCALNSGVVSTRFPNPVDSTYRVSTLKNSGFLEVEAMEGTTCFYVIGALVWQRSFLRGHICKLKPSRKQPRSASSVLSWLSPCLRSSKPLSSTSFTSSPGALMSSQGNCLGFQGEAGTL